jgi:FkbM family methyltransferase
MANKIVVIVGGECDYSGLTIPELKRYAKDVGAEFEIWDSPSKYAPPESTEYSRWSWSKIDVIKAYAESEDSIALIDADVYPIPGAPNLFDWLPAAAAFDPSLSDRLPSFSKEFLGEELIGNYYQAGVLVLSPESMRTLAENFDKVPTFEHIYEQTYLSCVINKSGLKMKTLPEEMNCLVYGRGVESRLGYVLHATGYGLPGSKKDLLAKLIEGIPITCSVPFKGGRKKFLTWPGEDSYSLQYLDGDMFKIGEMDPDSVNTVIDLGAHTGIFASCCLLQFPGCHVFSVEPYPPNCDLWNKNVSSVDGSDRATLIRALPWFEKGESEVRTWRSSMVQEFLNFPNMPKDMTVPYEDVLTLFPQDSMVDLLKIDVPGADVKILTYLANRGVLHKVRNLRVRYRTRMARRAITDLLNPYFKTYFNSPVAGVVAGISIFS